MRSQIESSNVAEIAVVGVDGCRAGWVEVELAVRVGEPSRVVRCVVSESLAPLADRVASRSVAFAGIDMPIGLPATERRASDSEARRFVGPRRSSVFPTPARVTLNHLDDYPGALAASRATIGVGLSKQAFNLLPKIAHLDVELDRTGVDDRLVEVHPEASFVAMGHGVFLETKKTAEGKAQRVSLIAEAFGDAASSHVATPPSGAGPDDVLDAFAVSWTAARLAMGRAVALGDPEQRDARGRPCVIWV